LDDADYRQACLQGLAQVKIELGEGGGSKNMADLALGMLGSHGCAE